MTVFGLVAAPASTFDDDGRIAGALSLPQSTHIEVEPLVREVRESHRRLSRVVSSGQEPAATFARTLATTLNVPYVELPALWNQHLGLWQGLHCEEFVRKYPKVVQRLEEAPESVNPPDGESVAELMSRLERVLEELRAMGGFSLVVVPNPIRNWLSRVAGGRFTADWSLVAATPAAEVAASMIEFVVEPDRVSNYALGHWQHWLRWPWKPRLQGSSLT